MPNDNRSFVQLRADLTQALTLVTMNSGLLLDELAKNEKADSRANAIFRASIDANAILKIMFQGEGDGGFTMQELRTVFGLGLEPTPPNPRGD